jgi:hypothetical protein
VKNENKRSFFKGTWIICLLALASIHLEAAADPYTISVVPYQPTPAEIWPNNTNYPYGTDINRFTKTALTEVAGNAATQVTIYQPAPSASGALPTSSPVVIYIHGYATTDPRAVEDFFGHLTRRGYTVLFLTYARMDIWDSFMLGTQNQQVYNSTKFGLNVLAGYTSDSAGKTITCIDSTGRLTACIASNGKRFISPTYETFADNAAANIVKYNKVKYVVIAHSVGCDFAAINADMAELNKDMNAPDAIVFHDPAGFKLSALTYWLQISNITNLSHINTGHTKTVLMLASESLYRLSLDGTSSDAKDSLLNLYKYLPQQGLNKVAYLVPSFRYPDPATNSNYAFSIDPNSITDRNLSQPGVITGKDSTGNVVKDSAGNVVTDLTSNHHGSLSGGIYTDQQISTGPDPLLPNAIDWWGYWLQTTAVIDYTFLGINDRFFRATDPSVDPLWNGASIFQTTTNPPQTVTLFNKKIAYPIADPAKLY